MLILFEPVETFKPIQSVSYTEPVAIHELAEPVTISECAEPAGSFAEPAAGLAELTEPAQSA